VTSLYFIAAYVTRYSHVAVLVSALTGWVLYFVPNNRQMVANIMFGRTDLKLYVESRSFLILGGEGRGRHEHKSAQNKGSTEPRMLAWNAFILP
jgi:hypothetical protein